MFIHLSGALWLTFHKCDLLFPATTKRGLYESSVPAVDRNGSWVCGID